MIYTSFLSWAKVMVVQLKSSGGNQPFSSLQCRTAVPKKETLKIKKVFYYLLPNLLNAQM